MNKKQFCKRIGITEAQFDGKEPVGGDLYLGGLTSIPDGFSPTVGRDLYLGGLTSNYTSLNNRLITWQNGKYISADGMFTEVIERKNRLFTVQKVNQEKVFYLYSDGAIHAHGDTPEHAKADYRFKKLSEKLKNTPIKTTDIVTVQMYRAITGACDAGVRMFMKSNGFEFEDQNGRTVEKTQITVAELLPILEKSNAYGVEKLRKLVSD